MYSLSNLSTRFAAAVSALALSVVLISGTVAVPGQATAQVATTYVSVLA